MGGGGGEDEYVILTVKKQRPGRYWSIRFTNDLGWDGWELL